MQHQNEWKTGKIQKQEEGIENSDNFVILTQLSWKYLWKISERKNDSRIPGVYYSRIAACLKIAFGGRPVALASWD